MSFTDYKQALHNLPANFRKFYTDGKMTMKLMKEGVLE